MSLAPSQQVCVHQVSVDPGVQFHKDDFVSIEIDPNHPNRKRLAPNIIPLEDGTFRMFYTADTEGGRLIQSAHSQDGVNWSVEDGVRLGLFQPFGVTAVQACDVITLPERGFRMYFEAHPERGKAVICSAQSQDGFTWEIEGGIRFGSKDLSTSFGTPRCLTLPDGAYRLYFHSYPQPFVEHDGENVIKSAFSRDGLSWEPEPGIRIAQERSEESYAVYGAEIVSIASGGYRMYYAGWSSPPEMRGRIFSAFSQDGLEWSKDSVPVIDLGDDVDALYCSEPAIIELPGGGFRLFYEACDTKNQWRILSATSKA